MARIRIPRILRKKRFYFILGLGLLLFLYYHLDIRYSDEVMIRRASNNIHGYKATIHHYDTLNRHIRYVEIGDEEKPLLILLHGAPSSSSFWMSFLKDSFLLSKFKIIAPDRPGYGYSDYGKVERSVAQQSAMVSAILKRKRKQHSTIILHGSSYGGTLAIRLAMDYPELVDGIILQSASSKAGAETTYDITYPTSKPPLNWWIPASLQMANLEKLSHREQLEAMEPLWGNIIAPMIILHGTSDGLILPENAEYSKEMVRNAPFAEIVWAEGRGHDLTWTRRSLILKSADRMAGIIDSIRESRAVLPDTMNNPVTIPH